MPDYHSQFSYGGYYHIFNRGNNGENIFLQHENYSFFLQQWSKYLSPYSKPLAYCLMPNHFHFLIRIIEDSTLDVSDDINGIIENQFRKLFSSYALAFNKRNRRTGSLFQKRFKRIEIDKDSYLTTIIQYIHHNPIHHGFSIGYKEWRFSSYNAVISDSATSVDRKAVLDWFGGRKAFLRFHEENLGYAGVRKLLIDYD